MAASRWDVSAPFLPLGYRPELDGLRGIAVLVVVLFHLGLGCPGGFVGVDIFFVLSGYLITALILRDLQSGEFSLAGFWERRIRRIFPALSAMVLATLVFAAFWLMPADYSKLGRSVIAQTLMSANFFFWRQAGGYFAESESHPLLHTWSLAVEEQFYIFFPPLLMLLFACGTRWRNRLAGTLLPAGFLLSLVAAAVLLPSRPIAVFYLLPTRAWELLGGALLAALPASLLSRNRPLREVAGWVGLAAMLAPVWAYSNQTPFPGLAALAPCAGAMAIIWSTTPLPGKSAPTSLAALLSFRALVFVGLISYSLYLWHWPVIIFFQYGLPVVASLSLTTKLALLGLAFVLAILSWRFVETPFRRKQIAGGRKAIFSLAVASVAASLGLSAGILFSHGWRMRFSGATQAAVLANNDAQSDRGVQGNVDLAALQAGKLLRFGAPAQAETPSVLLWGDSHARHAVAALDELCRERGLAGEAVVYSSTLPVVGTFFKTKDGLNEKSARWAEAVLAYVEARKIRHVVLAGYWGLRARENAAQLDQALHETVTRLEALHCQVWVLMDPPDQDLAPARALARTAITGTDTSAWWRTGEEHETRNAAIYALARRAGMGSAVFVDPAPFFWDAGLQRYRIENAGISLYYDHHHLTTRAARLYLLPALQRTLGRALDESVVRESPPPAPSLRLVRGI